MKTILKSKFEGGVITSKGYGGASYVVDITLLGVYDKKSPEVKTIEEIVDRFDHSLIVGEKCIESVVKNSRRVISINQPFMEESMLSQILFNLVFDIVGSKLYSVDLWDSTKFTYRSENKDESLVVSFENLKGK